MTGHYWQRCQERTPSVVDLPPQQHRVVFVRGVMAMLHEHAAPVAELHGEGHGAAGMQPVDVFASPLPRRHIRGATVARQDLAFLEMNVNGVVPSAAVINEVPHFAAAELRRCRDPAVVRIERWTAIGRDPPWTFARPVGDTALNRIPPEFERSLS